ncbi:MAG TPA: glycosyltransferase family 1 protein [Terriglobia bacterium]|nr:glycosyltransferase family 1 protein [Terriglobia bacterium]
MLVAVDTLFLSGRYQDTGTGVYLSKLLPACLMSAEASGSGMEFIGFASPGEHWNRNGLGSPRLSVRRSRMLAHPNAWLLGGMAANTSLARPDVVFLPTAHWSIPNPLIPSVITVLDAMPFRLPAEIIGGCRRLRGMTRINARLARRILTISAWSKRDLVDIFNFDPGRVTVTYIGYDRNLYNTDSPAAEAAGRLLSRFGIRKPFILHHGMVQLRKNLVRLIHAWERISEAPGALEAQLVLAGPPGLGYAQIRQAAESSRLKERIIFTGSLEAADLASLVKSATLSVIPSLYEGFCLPLVESMACGVPTIASRAACIPEVSGGILEYFNPASEEEMAESMRRAIEDSGLRERLRRNGLARAGEFSWENCARQTLEVLAEAAAG